VTSTTHPPPVAPRLKKEQSYTSTPPLCLHAVLWAEPNFTPPPPHPFTEQTENLQLQMFLALSHLVLVNAGWLALADFMPEYREFWIVGYRIIGVSVHCLYRDYIPGGCTVTETHFNSPALLQVTWPPDPHKLKRRADSIGTCAVFPSETLVSQRPLQTKRLPAPAWRPLGVTSRTAQPSQHPVVTDNLSTWRLLRREAANNCKTINCRPVGTHVHILVLSFRRHYDAVQHRATGHCLTQCQTGLAVPRLSV
jgi:hypothetical protein